MHLAKNVCLCMAKEKTVYELKEMLKELYEKKSSSSKLILIRQLFNMWMKETEEATTHVNTFNRVLTELASQSLTSTKK